MPINKNMLLYPSDNMLLLFWYISSYIFTTFSPVRIITFFILLFCRNAEAKFVVLLI